MTFKEMMLDYKAVGILWWNIPAIYHLDENWNILHISVRQLPVKSENQNDHFHGKLGIATKENSSGHAHFHALFLHAYLTDLEKSVYKKLIDDIFDCVYLHRICSLM